MKWIHNDLSIPYLDHLNQLSIVFDVNDGQCYELCVNYDFIVIVIEVVSLEDWII